MSCGGGASWLSVLATGTAGNKVPRAGAVEAFADVRTRRRARAGSLSSSRTSARIAPQSSPVSVTWSGVISQVSRTLRSISVRPPRPNRAGRAQAIIRLACGALTGKLTGPAPATVSRTSLAGTDSCALNASRRRRAAVHPGKLLPWRDRHPGPSCRLSPVSQVSVGKNGIHWNGPGASRA